MNRNGSVTENWIVSKGKSICQTPPSLSFFVCFIPLCFSHLLNLWSCDQLCATVKAMSCKHSASASKYSRVVHTNWPRSFYQKIANIVNRITDNFTSSKHLFSCIFSQLPMMKYFRVGLGNIVYSTTVINFSLINLNWIPILGHLCWHSACF